MLLVTLSGLLVCPQPRTNLFEPSCSDVFLCLNKVFHLTDRLTGAEVSALSDSPQIFSVLNR